MNNNIQTSYDTKTLYDMEILTIGEKYMNYTQRVYKDIMRTTDRMVRSVRGCERSFILFMFGIEASALLNWCDDWNSFVMLINFYCTIHPRPSSLEHEAILLLSLEFRWSIVYIYA